MGSFVQMLLMLYEGGRDMFIIDDLIAIAIAAGAVAGGVVIYEHWDDIKKWAKTWFDTTVKLVTDVLKGAWHATMVILNVAADGLVEITHTLFTKDRNGDFIAHSKTIKMTKENLPPRIIASHDKAVAEGKPVDISVEAERELELAYSKI